MKKRKMFRQIFQCILLIPLLAFSPGEAAGPIQRTYKNFTEFINGKLENLSLTSEGRLSLAATTRLLIDSGEPYIWDITSDDDGNLFLGTGNKGKVFRISASGDTSLYFTAEEPEVYAVAHDSRGSLFVATSPQGRIYQIDSKGAARVFYEPGQAYIWDMGFDSQGDLWVATGGKAQLLRIAPAGHGTVILTSEAEHLRCLTLEGETVYAGSSRPGLVYRIRKGEKPFVLYDTGAEEVHSLAAVAGGSLYAATSTTAGTALTITQILGAAAPRNVPAQGEREDEKRESTPGERIAQEEILPSAKTQLVCIEKDGYGRSVWPPGRDNVQSLLSTTAGDVLVGTGDAGRLYSIDKANNISLLMKIEATQISALHRTAQGKLVLAASNMGLAYSIETRGKSGIYESETVDAAVLTDWGTIRWRGEGDLAFQTRSGNTQKPEGTWSVWQPLKREGESWYIMSPAARFLQWRCTMQNGSRAPALEEVTFSYITKNRPPEIRDLQILPPGDYFETGQEQVSREIGIAVAPPIPKREVKKGFRSVVWQFEDPNQDPLLFSLWYRRIGDEHWRRLAAPIAHIVHSWDTTQMADGDYQLKLEASDSSALPPGRGLGAEKISPPFMVDNTAPVIQDVAVLNQGTVKILKFTVSDAASSISRVQLSINAGGWVPLYPEDGINDSLREQFSYSLQSGSAPLEISIFAADLLDNCNIAHKLIKGM